MDTTSVSLTDQSVPLREKFAYGVGCLGQNMIYTFFGTFLLYFYTEIFGILPAAAGLLLLISRIWDAVNDPMMGILVDRTQSRWGKFRPYLLFSPILFAIFAVLCFANPQFSDAGRLVYAYITYIIFGMVYTASDVPYWALSGAITTDAQERNSIVMFPRFVGTFGAAIATVGTLPLIYLFRDLAGGNTAAGYQLTAALYGIITIGCFLVTFLFVKERVQPVKDRKTTFRTAMQAITRNRPLMIVIISGFFSGIAQTAKLQALIYYAAYNLNSESLYTLLVGINIPFLLVGILLVPFFTRYLGKKGTYIASNIVYAVSSLGFFLSGWDSFITILIWNCLGSFAMGIPLVIQTSMIADTIEYAELYTGERAEGTIFSTQTFLAKLTAAATSGLIGFLLATLGFRAGAMQSQQVLSGIHSITALLPFFASAVAFVTMLFYPLSEKEHARIVQQLAERATAP
ncbi:MAG: glycoside-pentoside-hexuronide (GPH):cation symporter [Spirochaetia bacterium]|nr:glycoside-pentoside-hexuronide (GPH):cation symporter [Spirochaetia bacterium]